MMKMILVAVDFSEVTEGVIDTAGKLARALRCDVRLIHVIPPDPDFVGYDVGPSSERVSVGREYRDHHRHLQALARMLLHDGGDVSEGLVCGSTVERILSECCRTEADMIVMGSHGHGAMYDLLVGSAAEGVLRGATCPVVLVPRSTA